MLENKARWNRKPKTPARQDAIEYLDGSTKHKDKSFAAQWSVTKRVLKGGNRKELSLTRITGSLKSRFRLAGWEFDIRMGDLRLGWTRPSEVVHPSHIQLESRGGRMAEGFNEWRCVADSNSPDTREPSIHRQHRRTASLTLTLHGKIQNIPHPLPNQRRPEPLTEFASAERLREILLRPQTQVVTEISTVPGSDTFQISDKLTNEGSSAQEFQLIYHGNYGSSILEKGAMVYAPAKSVTPMNEHAVKGIADWQTYAEPTPGFVEKSSCSNLVRCQFAALPC